MMREAQIEQILILLNEGVKPKYLSKEFGIDEMAMKDYCEQINIRNEIKTLVIQGKVREAINVLNIFIQNSEYNIVERLMLARLESYMSKELVKEETIEAFDLERREAGFSKSIDEVIKSWGIIIPRRKSSNIRKSLNEPVTEKKDIQEPKDDEEEEISLPDYEKVIEKYKKELENNPSAPVNKRNLLAFAYFRAGKFDEARDELITLIDETKSYYAYKQIIHIEIISRNLDDAKFWAEEALKTFPQNIEIMEQMISIAKKQGDYGEAVKILKQVVNLNPGNARNKERLKRMQEDR